MAPFRYDQYQAPYVQSIAALMQQPGQAQAQAALSAGEAQARAAQQIGNAQAQAAQQSGQAWGGAIQNIGQAIGAIPQQLQEQKLMAERAQTQGLQRELMQGQLAAQQGSRATEAQRNAAMQSGSRGAVLKALEADPDGYERAVKHFEAIDTSMNRVLGTVAAGVRGFGDQPQAAVAAIDDLIDKGFDPQRMNALKQQIQQNPGAVSHLVDALLLQSPDAEHRSLVKKPEKPAEPFTLSEGQTRFDPSGQPLASVAKPEPVERPQNPTEASLALAAANGDPAALKALNMIRAKTEAEPLVAIMGPDGQSVLVRRSQAEGKRPASNREQGRPVTSGDAGDLANYQTALDDLKTLRSTLSETSDATGFRAQVTAAIPYLPSDAKNRQAVIDRVKQVIGKTLEGGVLRKEDEAKYEKILPTIKDPPSVVTSKIDGLEKAINQRNTRKLEGLADAGYDTSKFSARAPAAPKADPLGLFKK